MSKNKITSYFTTANVQKKVKQETENSEISKSNNISINRCNDIVIEKQPQILNQLLISNEEEVKKKVKKRYKSNKYSLDIGHFANGSKIAEVYLKSLIILKSNIPEPNFTFPFSNHNKKGKTEKRFLRKNHFEKYPWLEYSNIENGLFCKYLVLFLTSKAPGSFF